MPTDTRDDEAMAAPIIKLILTIINLYWWVIIATAVMSWLVAFQVVDTRNQFVQSAWRALDALTEPVLRPIRRSLAASTFRPSSSCWPCLSSRT